MYWGQRVLDLMRDAAGDVGPGRLALRRHSSVISSNVTTKPLTASSSRSAAMRTSSVRVLFSPRSAPGPALAGRDAAPPLRAVGHLGRDFGEMLADRPVEVDAEQRRAERFGRLTRPARSSPITPAETPVNTVSVNRRRSSSCRLASSSSRC